MRKIHLSLSSFEYYIHKNCVAMGTKMGPSYACLFVGYVEEKMLLTYTGTKPIMSRRYIDEYIGINIKLRKNSKILCNMSMTFIRH